MSLVMKRFTKGVVLKGITDETTIASLDGEGAIFQNSSDLRLKAYIEGSVRQIVTNSQSQVLTNKTIDLDNNTVSNIQTSNLKAGVLNTSTTLASASDTQLPSALAVKTYVDNSVASKDQASEISYDNTTSGLAALNLQTAVDEVDGNVDNLVSLSGVALDSTTLGTFTGTTIPDNQTVKQALQSLESSHETHTGASTNVHGLGVGSSVVGTTDSQALTNKTLTGAVINGSTKISAFLLEESEDNSQSGSLVTLTSITKPIVRLTNASLVSVTGITASEITGHGGVVTLINTTANEITVLNNAGTASEAILTGTDDDIDLAPNGCLLLKYDTVSDKWRVIGGTGSGSVVIKALAGENLNAKETVYLSIGASDSGRTSGSAYKLDASNDNRIEFVGFVKETVLSGATAKIVTSGILKGFTGLSVGQPVYLNPNTPGVYTQTDPSDSSYNARWVIKLGTAISSTQVLINPDLASSAYFNPEIVSNFSIANNQSSVANITSLIIDGASYRGFIIEYTLYRKTDTNETAQVGRLRGVYKTVANTWLMSDDYSGENAGVTFSITSSGQLQYTSTDISGTNYLGVFDYKVTDLFEVI
jgi:hypothetical protein